MQPRFSNSLALPTRPAWSRRTTCPMTCSPTPKPLPGGACAPSSPGGGAAHLPGMLAAKTPVPVLGVPVQTKALSGVDSLHSIVQMPKGIPVATFAIGPASAANATLFAVAMLAADHPSLRAKLDAFRAEQTEIARAMTVPPCYDNPHLPGAQPHRDPLGVMGGGQLGRMFVHAAHAWAFCGGARPRCAKPGRTRQPPPHPNRLYRPQGLAQLAATSAAITTEFENVPAAALADLARYKPWPRRPSAWPSPRTVPAKSPFHVCGVPVAPHAVITTAAEPGGNQYRFAARHLEDRPHGLRRQRPGARDHPAELAAAWADLKNVPCVLEKMLALELECSVIVARGADGVCVTCPCSATCTGAASWP